jgi:hypothetical protein
MPSEIWLEPEEMEHVSKLLDEWSETGTLSGQKSSLFTPDYMNIQFRRVHLKIRNEDFYGYSGEEDEILLFCKGSTIWMRRRPSQSKERLVSC